MIEYSSGHTMEISDKVNQRTHHTRFFEKLYGNLEKSSESKDEKLDQNFQLNIPVESCRPEVINSPSESSASSSEMFHNDLHPRCEHYFLSTKVQISKVIKKIHRSSMFLSSNEIGLNNFPSTIIPSHFNAIRLPIGFSSDPHNHFAAFRKLEFVRWTRAKAYLLRGFVWPMEGIANDEEPQVQNAVKEENCGIILIWCSSPFRLTSFDIALIEFPLAASHVTSDYIRFNYQVAFPVEIRLQELAQNRTENILRKSK